MKVLKMRAAIGIAELKGEQAWSTDMDDVALSALPNGGIIVSRFKKNVLIPAAQVQYAVVEPDEAEPVKRGPGRPPKNEQP